MFPMWTQALLGTVSAQAMATANALPPADLEVSALRQYAVLRPTPNSLFVSAMRQYAVLRPTPNSAFVSAMRQYVVLAPTGYTPPPQNVNDEDVEGAVPVNLTPHTIVIL